MVIVNPIYDIVFKFLMQDVDIAKAILSAILGVPITRLEFAAHERVLEAGSSVKLEDPIKQVLRNLSLFRMDFVAVVTTSEGKEKELLIEVQKAKLAADAWRFRQYLSIRYREERKKLGKQIKAKTRKTAKKITWTDQVLPIVMIVILGFEVDKDYGPGVRVERTYRRLFTEEEVTERNDFLECLSHDLYLLQAQKLRLGEGGEAERLLSVFSQQGFLDDNEQLIEYPMEGVEKGGILWRVLTTLNRLSQNPEVREKMKLEDEMYTAVQKELAALEGKAEEERARAAEERAKTAEALKQVAELREKEEAARRWAEDASRLAESERVQKEEERRQKEEERRQKEEAEARAAEERRQKEEAEARASAAQRLAEQVFSEAAAQRAETEQRLEAVLRMLTAGGMSETEARQKLGL